MMTERCPSGEELLGFVRQALDDDDASRVGAHVGSCDDCRERIAGLQKTTRLLERAGEARPPHDVVRCAAECPDPELIAAYADGSADADTSTMVERHVARCGSCLAELADLWHLSSGGAVADAPERAVVGALARLEVEGRTAIVRWAGATVSVVKDFARAQAEVLEEALAGDGGLQPAFARAGAEAVLISWRGEHGLVLEGRIDIRSGGHPALTGRLTRLGRPDLGLSAALSGTGERHGPESLDSEGRFGPWGLAGGENTLRVTGRSVGERGLSLMIEIDGDQEAAPEDAPEDGYGAA